MISIARCIIFVAGSGLVHAAPANYGVITDTYGIVTEQDIKRAADIAEPGPIKPGEGTAFTVWQCYPTTEYTAICAKHDSYDPQITRRLVLRLVHQGHLSDFIERRPSDEKNCLEGLADWKRIFTGEKIACVSASYDQDVPVTGDKGVTRHLIWTIDRVKSRHGSWSYFIDQ